MRAEAPLVWVLQGLKRGDNAQARELAARLPAQASFKDLRYNWLYRLPNFLLGSGLASLRDGAGGLAPPWPDLVIGVGRRSVPVARWIRKKSGGRTRLVHIGRPRARLDIFDLVITTPQYGLPPAGNVVELVLPLTAASSLPQGELEFWNKEFADLPRPIIAALIGGPAWPFLMPKTQVADILRSAEAMREAADGSLIIIGSPRTPKYVFEDNAGDGIRCRHFAWSAGGNNPYKAALRLADRFVVTSDSVSMIAEALRTGKRVDVYRLPIRTLPRLPLGTWPFSMLVNWGVIATRRDVNSFVSRLIEQKHVGVVGDTNDPCAPIPNDENQVIERVRALLSKG